MAAATEAKGLPRLRRSFVWPWMFVSGVVHAIVALSGLAAASSGTAGLLAGRGTETGTGFGGDSVDLEIAGPEDEAPVGAMPPAEDLREGAPPMAPDIPVEPVQRDEEPLTAESTAPPAPRPPRAETEDEPAAPAPEEAEAVPGTDADTSLATDTTEAVAPGDGETSGGTGAEDSTSGAPAGDPGALILGSAGVGGDLVGARRALLPNGGMCDDPAAGVWRAQRYDAGRRQWVQFTLRIRRDPSGGLTGTIRNRSFTGRPGNPMPGPCTAFGFDMTWGMPARGRYQDGRMTFEARSARLVRADCPDSGHTYFPDRFRGTVQPMRDVFHAVNNDGQAEFDQPYTFRRVSCE